MSFAPQLARYSGKPQPITYQLMERSTPHPRDLVEAMARAIEHFSHAKLRTFARVLR